VEGGAVQYSTDLGSLRMATDYTLRISPLEDAERRSSGRALGGPAVGVLRTRGFSARAVSCLPNATLIEVNTGPHFRGLISVEGSNDPRCSTKGDGTSPSLLLRVPHTHCRVAMGPTAATTTVLVQENLPILTHSARRFRVVCNFVPESFTVSAGVSLPEELERDPLLPVGNSVDEVDPSELFDSTSSLFGGPGGVLGRPDGVLGGSDVVRGARGARRGKALTFIQEEPEQHKEGLWAQLALTGVVAVAAVVGLSCVAWHFGRQAGMALARRRDANMGDMLEEVSIDGSEESRSEGGETAADAEGAAEESSSNQIHFDDLLSVHLDLPENNPQLILNPSSFTGTPILQKLENDVAKPRSDSITIETDGSTVEGETSEETIDVPTADKQNWEIFNVSF